MLQVLEDGLNEWNARDINWMYMYRHKVFFFVGETQFNESSLPAIHLTHIYH